MSDEDEASMLWDACAGLTRERALAHLHTALAAAERRGMERAEAKRAEAIRLLRKAAQWLGVESGAIGDLDAFLSEPSSPCCDIFAATGKKHRYGCPVRLHEEAEANMRGSQESKR